MKKLMIAAVAAASTAALYGAFAPEAEFDETTMGAAEVYDFTATLKTTKGKMGKESKTTYTVNLGWDGAAKFWYDDSNINKGDGRIVINKTVTLNGKTYNVVLKDCTTGLVVHNAKKDTYSLDKKVLKGMSDIQKMALAMAFGWNGTAYNGKFAETTYNTKSLNKWCESFTFVVPTPAACYRVSGSEKFKGYIDSACCILGTDPSFVRFGGQTLSKATKVEVYDSVAFDLRNFTGYLAGQGSWSAKLVKDDNDEYVEGVSSVSGNIVGYMDAPDCMSCCKYPAEAVAFECDADDDTDLTTDATAAYGTWSMKINKKLFYSAN